MKKRTGTKSVSVILDGELWTKAKIVGFHLQKPIGTIIEEALQKEVERLQSVIERSAQQTEDDTTKV